MMKNNRKKPILFILFLSTSLSLTGIFNSCTKYQNGFLSPYVEYAVNEFSITRGRVSASYSLITDGSDIPMHVKWLHFYDSTGKIVDDLFTKKYQVTIWTAAYDPNTDKTFAAITAKRALDSLPPLVVNESNGTISANSGSLYLPLGTYSMDLEVSNSAGTQVLKNIMKIHVVDGKSLEMDPEQGAFSNSLLNAGAASGAGALGGPNGGVFYNGSNNPYDLNTVTRFADTPNIFILKITDRNGVPFNPRNGEVAKRPNSGLNPNPPFLQNLQDYAPDTFEATDTALILRYPLVPFPIASLGNGFNMYYRIPSQYVRIDSTTSWSGNGTASFYTGASDPHYLGVYTDGRFDYSLRVPMRIQVPGAYEVVVKILNATHK
jgi:hypothetical protein